MKRYGVKRVRERAGTSFHMITIPLKTETWQRDVLSKRMELVRSLQNVMVGEGMRRYHRMLEDDQYLRYREVVDEVYGHRSYRVIEREKESEAYQAALTDQREVLRRYGFTQMSFSDRAIELSKPYKALLPSRVANYSIGRPVWNSFHDMIINGTRGGRRRRRGEVYSLSSDGRSGIRLIDDAGKALREGISLTQDVSRGGRVTPQLYCVYGKTSGDHVLRLPLKIDPSDEYLIGYLRRPLHMVSIHRQVQHGHDKYYALLMVEDDPA